MEPCRPDEWHKQFPNLVVIWSLVTSCDQTSPKSSDLRESEQFISSHISSKKIQFISRLPLGSLRLHQAPWHHAPWGANSGHAERWAHRPVSTTALGRPKHVKVMTVAPWHLNLRSRQDLGQCLVHQEWNQKPIGTNAHTSKRPEEDEHAKQIKTWQDVARYDRTDRKIMQNDAKWCKMQLSVLLSSVLFDSFLPSQRLHQTFTVWI